MPLSLDVRTSEMCKLSLRPSSFALFNAGRNGSTAVMYGFPLKSTPRTCPWYEAPPPCIASLHLAANCTVSMACEESLPRSTDSSNLQHVNTAACIYSV